MYYLSKIVRGGKITAGKWAGGGIGIRAALRTLSPKGLWVRVPPCPPKVFIPSGKRWRFLSPHKNSGSERRSLPPLDRLRAEVSAVELPLPSGMKGGNIPHVLPHVLTFACPTPGCYAIA